MKSKENRVEENGLPGNDLKHLMRDHFIRYASYVILDRAIPDVVDGLKPVQRRILHTLRVMHDGKLHKVANVAGQTMAYHPHGDASINEALINLANKGYLLDQQGNFGNVLTGDPAAAARYIETRLSPLAMQTLFNPAITEYIPSYDGRKEEPVTLPAKIPLLLMQGAEGIAVGMATRILPHNFIELLEAEIAILEERSFKIYPDFYTGGIMDASEYAKGKGKVKLRAKIEIQDPKTVVITQICYGTTTESLIKSIDEAAKKGKIKIDSINDYTAEKVEVEIKLPRGAYAQDLIDALYAYTECEVSLSSQMVVIKEGLPWECDVEEILRYHTEKLQGYIKRELEIERDALLEKIFEKTLEQIFIENRLYKKIEEIKTYEKIHEVIAEGLKPFHSQLTRVPTYDDRERLLNIPIRRISRFDVNKNQDEIMACKEELGRVEKNLRQIKQVTIDYLKDLIKKYAKEFPRRTRKGSIEEVDVKAIELKEISVGFDSKTGFLGTSVKGDISIPCTNYDKMLLFFRDGTYKVINIPEKEYLQTGDKTVLHVGVADKKTTFNVIYSESKTNIAYAKRFVVEKFILDKEYNFFEAGCKLEFFTKENDIALEVKLAPKAKQKVSSIPFTFSELLVKGVTAKGVRVSPRPIKKVLLAGKSDGKQLELF